ncbi:MAG: hypothetical protein PWR10_695 [Halanaerobiales bacterium]|nr:hypothetical protein [Halanaerobiales bacterium]
MILAIDPGRDKCGLAVLDGEMTVRYQGIVSGREIEAYLKQLLNRFEIEGIVLGNGTFSEEMEERLKQNFNLPVHLIDEAYTTCEAEKRYREEHFRGLKSILRFISWKPSRPVDDYVAVILAERYLANRR